MVYRKRTVRKPRKRVATLSRVPRVRRSMNMLPMIKIARTFWFELWQPSAVATSNFWRYYAPSISSLPALSEFTALFDQYKINGVKITLRPKFDNYAGNDNTSVSTTRQSTNVHYIVDPNSNVTPTGVYSSATCNAFLENGRVRSSSGTRTINIYYRPKIAATNQGISDSERTGPRWLSLANSQAVLQNGVHIFMQDSNFANNQTQAFDVFYTYYMQFRGTK